MDSDHFDLAGLTLADADALTEVGGQAYAAFTLMSEQDAQPSTGVILHRTGGSKWREVFRTDLPPSFVEINGRRHRVNVRQGFSRFVVARLPGRNRDMVLSGLVTLGRSKILEIAGAEVHRHPSPGLGDRLPPAGVMASLNGRLFAMPARPQVLSHGATRRPADLFVAAKGGLGDWVPAGEPGCDNEDNLYISDMLAYAGCLYVATVNPVSGFQLWRTDAAGDPPFTWARVISEGAYRYTLNTGITGMAEHAGRLYLATGTLGPGAMNIGDRGPELIRIDAAGTWEIVVGMPRFTPDGLKRPLSEIGAGFGDPKEAAFTGLHSFGGRIIVRRQSYVADDEGGVGGFRGPGEGWASDEGDVWERIQQKDTRAAAISGWGMLIDDTVEPEGTSISFDSA